MISTLTVPALKSLASDMGIVVPSKARKADIVALISDAIETAHSEAIDFNRERDFWQTIRKGDTAKATPVKREAKSYSERSISRSLTYARQNGFIIGDTDDVYPAKHFTAKQRRRAAKKYNAQYAKISAKLS